ncbi:MAG: putative periplasmic solute-binding protein [Oscillospiraceae bacterium]|jgi:UPF0755 protein|nr:putative periplasmic solute-binding protein [Oscillospiraceae bacterium]
MKDNNTQENKLNENPENDDNEALLQEILNAKEKVQKEKDAAAKETTESEENLEEEIIEDVEEEEIKEEKHKRKKKKKRSYKKLYFILLLAIFIVGISSFAAIYIIRIGKDAFGIDQPSNPVEINIPKGSTTADIAQILQENGIIEEPLIFRLFSKLKHADSLYKEGNHTLRPDMSYDVIVEELQKESQRDTVDITFPEGITLIECAKLLEKNEVCKADDFIYAFNSASFGYDFESQVTNSKLKFYKMEGYFFPDTYKFYKNSEPQIVAKKIYANFAEKVNNNLMGRMKELNITLDETITLASIVQAEAPVSYDMKNVASVFWNRLRNKDKFPLLQSDPTTKYVNEVIKPNIEVENEEMYIAYDTYQGPGLPPGAICNPGLDAIEAVLYPNDTDYFYFCANLETKECFYAKTLNEHEQNLVKAGLTGK